MYVNIKNELESYEVNIDGEIDKEDPIDQANTEIANSDT